jgi:diguanylate cyclase (GGDEF)-like protein
VQRFVSGGPVQQAERLQGVRRDGSAFLLEASLAKTGDPGMAVTAILRDITAQVQTEERIRRFARVAEVLSDINGLIVRVRQRDELFHESCRIAVDKGGFLRAWIGVLAPEKTRLVLAAYCDRSGPEHHDYEQHLATALRGDANLHPELVEAFFERRALAVNDLQDGDLDWPMRDVALAGGTRAIAWLPLSTQHGPVGMLTLHADTPGVFDEQEMRLLRELAGDMSFALEHLAQQEHVERLAFYDPLTGLPNEALLRERLGALLAEAQAEAAAEGEAAGAGRQLSLVLVDLVHFKRINDAIGRRAGDALLCEVAGRLRQCFGESPPLARIVADRFAAILVEAPGAGPELATTLAEHHQRCFAAPFEVEGERLRVDARFGVAQYPHDGPDAEALIRHAEVALKHAKGGSDRLVFHDARMSAAVAATLALENELRVALERDEFVLHYQPKVDVDTRRLTGVEALLRWQSPTRGLVPPLQFIGLLEETGLIVPVGLWAVRRAAQDHRRWRERFGAAPAIAVNVSAVQLRRDDFVADVLAALDAEGAGAGAIDLEVTESLLMLDVEAAIAKLGQLHAREVCIAIDDFGTGYSSLAYLSKLPAQVLKIDRSFIAAMMTDPDSMTLVATMISLAHSLRLRVVAEGVETEEQAKILRLLRCDQMQGYLVSRPVPEAEVVRWLNGPES